jgi:hypothetical protein
MGELTKNLSLREVFGEEIRGWRKFRRALRKEDQELFDQLFDKARLQVDAGRVSRNVLAFQDGPDFTKGKFGRGGLAGSPR